MKLRIQSKDLRVRVDSRDIATLRSDGIVSEEVSLGGHVLRWSLIVSEEGAQAPTLSFDGGEITVGLAPSFVERWATTNELGLEAEIGGTTVVVEKDLKKR